MTLYDGASRVGSRSAVADQASAFLSAVYGWMCVGGLAITALALYLDFTNLFLFLLRFTGNRRD